MDLDNFINSIIEEKNLKGLTPETKTTVANELKSALVEQINRAILLELPDEKLDELDNLMNEEGFGDENMQAFLKDSGVNIEKITAETMIKFKAFYLGSREA